MYLIKVENLTKNHTEADFARASVKWKVKGGHAYTETS